MVAGRKGAARAVAVPAGGGPSRAYDRELLVRPAPQRTVLGHALNLLAGAAIRFRNCFGSPDPVWSLIGFFAHGRLLAARRPIRS